jgi:membrane-bound metal-dependent hydrolase YbcI (DUF457 family)
MLVWREVVGMFAVGHVALGYLTGKFVGRALGEDINVPVIWALSLIPDIDLFIPGLRHRGPTHSVIVSFIIFLPFLLVRARRALPYFLALITHPLLGDYPTGEVQLLWPVSNEWLVYGRMRTGGSLSEAYVEWILFAAMIFVIYISKDHTRLFNSDKRT